MQMSCDVCRDAHVNWIYLNKSRFTDEFFGQREQITFSTIDSRKIIFWFRLKLFLQICRMIAFFFHIFFFLFWFFFVFTIYINCFANRNREVFWCGRNESKSFLWDPMAWFFGFFFTIFRFFFTIFRIFFTWLKQWNEMKTMWERQNVFTFWHVVYMQRCHRYISYLTFNVWNSHIGCQRMKALEIKEMDEDNG